MNRIKVSKDFYLDEYIGKSFYKTKGASSRLWIRPELIICDQFIRDRFGYPIIMNDWATGGQRQQSGLRYPYANIGAKDSFHKFGVASDKTFVGAPPSIYDEVREDIEKNWKTLYKPLGLTRIEAQTETWLHTDCANTGLEHLYIFNP